jgi:microcin C transport system substrate-binding protein
MLRRSRLAQLVLPVLLTAVAATGPGCGGDSGDGAAGTGGGGDESAATTEFSYDFPEDVPFDPAEWTTVTDYPPLGDPRAVRDDGSRPFVEPWLTFPPTLRTDGPNSNLTTLSTVHALMFETLVGLHPETEEFIPSLASHWKIEKNPDGKTQTFWFRIDDRARFSNGDPVTAADVYYTFWHMVQEDRNDPSQAMTYGEGFEMPEVIDRLTLKIKTKSLNWRLFLYFGAGMKIFPAKECSIPGKQYLEEYNWKFMSGSGPYILKSEKDLKKGDSITLTRRDDWWAENEPSSKHTYNFTKLKFLVISNEELIYETFKKGELDWYLVGRAQRWVEEIPKEKSIQNGWVQKRKIYNQAPNGFSGIAFNMRKPPFDDQRVRLAFAHLFNRERLIEKLFFNQYEPLNTTLPGRDWGAGDENPMITFDPERALELLAEAGYKERDDAGYLVGPDGERFSVTLPFANQGWERIWLVVKEDYEDAGIEFNLKLLDGSTLMKLITERQFSIHFQSWGALLFPNPETSWRSDLADKPANNNICGYKNPEVDALFERYNEVFERAEQKAITRQIDKLVCAEIPYAFGWYANYRRVLYWNRFGHPDTYVTRIGQRPVDSMMATWWRDPEREAALDAATRDGTALPQYDGEGEERIVKPWAGK